MQGTSSWSSSVSAFVTDRGFLCTFPDLVGGLCSSVLMLIHALICVLFLVYAGCCRRSGRGINTRLAVLFCRAMVGCCRRPGRGTSTGLSLVDLHGSGSLRPEATWLSEVAHFLPAFPLGGTGRLTIEHDHFVRFVDGGFGRVQMCVAGGVDANVFTCFSVGVTGLNSDTVRLFFTAGGIGDPRVVLIFRFSLSGSGMSFFPAIMSSASLSLFHSFSLSVDRCTDLTPLHSCTVASFSQPCHAHLTTFPTHSRWLKRATKQTYI